MQTDALSQTFAALADPTRRAILERLAAGPANDERADQLIDEREYAAPRNLVFEVWTRVGWGQTAERLAAYVEQRSHGWPS